MNRKDAAAWATMVALGFLFVSMVMVGASNIIANSLGVPLWTILVVVNLAWILFYMNGRIYK